MFLFKSTWHGLYIHKQQGRLYKQFVHPVCENRLQNTLAPPCGAHNYTRLHHYNHIGLCSIEKSEQFQPPLWNSSLQVTCFFGLADAGGPFSGDKVWKRNPRELRGARGLPSEMLASFCNTARGWLSKDPLFTWRAKTRQDLEQMAKIRMNKSNKLVLTW